MLFKAMYFELKITNIMIEYCIWPIFNKFYKL